jgi:hypothetical protein
MKGSFLATARYNNKLCAGTPQNQPGLCVNGVASTKNVWRYKTNDYRAILIVHRQNCKQRKAVKNSAGSKTGKNTCTLRLNYRHANLLRKLSSKCRTREQLSEK